MKKYTHEKAHEEIDYIFKTLLPQRGMAERPEQIRLCHSILDAMLDGSIALCDAGTGIGKTFAYLTAGILHGKCRAAEGKPQRPILISTSSIALQSAIQKEYLPLLSSVLLSEGLISAPIEAVIRKGVAAIEAATGFTADLPAKTLTEVINLSEYPTPMVGTFDEEFLKVPEEIIVDAMLMHQRYFPLYDADGKLTNKFIIVSNGDPAHEDTIVDGNERVVAARLYDAKFFYDEDLKLPLDAYVDRLDEVVFQEALGTMRDKTARVVKLSARITSAAGIEAAEMRDIARSAYLAKADLVTSAVIEFTSVQGIMGSYYAKAAGETDAVARAIADHYRPRFSGDDVPAERVGCIVAIADKLDTICGLFAIGQGPTGSSDPFALRRSALGIVTMLLSDKGLDISLGAAIDVALASYAAQGIEFDAAAVRADVVDFFITRTKVMAKDEGAAPDAIDAVLAVSVEEPVVFMQRVRALVAAREQQAETFDDLATAYARANNLRDEKLGTNVDESLLGDEERALLDAVTAAEGKVAEHLAGNEYAAALAELANLRGPIDAFFDGVMVMDENEAIRENRLRLLNRFVAVFKDVADFGKMAKK